MELLLFIIPLGGILSKYISNDNITVIELNEAKSALDFDKVDESALEEIKAVIITHLLSDLDLSCLEKYKEKYNWLVVEDRVRGTVNTPFSHPVVDMSFYSMGMDKRPCALVALEKERKK